MILQNIQNVEHVVLRCHIVTATAHTVEKETNVLAFLTK
jgi:hypothetical protein